MAIIVLVIVIYFFDSILTGKVYLGPPKKITEYSTQPSSQQWQPSQQDSYKCLISSSTGEDTYEDTGTKVIYDEVLLEDSHYCTEQGAIQVGQRYYCDNPAICNHDFEEYSALYKRYYGQFYPDITKNYKCSDDFSCTDFGCLSSSQNDVCSLTKRSQSDPIIGGTSGAVKVHITGCSGFLASVYVVVVCSCDCLEHCGNDQIDSAYSEVCDTNQFISTCESRCGEEYEGEFGPLNCQHDCTYISCDYFEDEGYGCWKKCGNGLQDEGEECDPPGFWCEHEDFECENCDCIKYCNTHNDCPINYVCTNHNCEKSDAICGNSRIENPPEVCDPPDSYCPGVIHIGNYYYIPFCTNDCKRCEPQTGGDRPPF